MYMTGTISNCTTTTGISETIMGACDYTPQFKTDFQGDSLVAPQKYSAGDYAIPVQEEPKIKSNKMEVELCLCSKALWS